MIFVVVVVIFLSKFQDCMHINVKKAMLVNKVRCKWLVFAKCRRSV